jgi:hypothetical protein
MLLFSFHSFIPDDSSLTTGLFANIIINTLTILLPEHSRKTGRDDGQ